MKSKFIIFLITLFFSGITKSQNVTIKEFNNKTTYGKIDTLMEDSIALLVKLKYIKQFEVEEIEKITIHTGKGTKGISTIIGIGIGLIPGIILLSSEAKSEGGGIIGGIAAASVTFTTKILGGVLLPVGGIIGGIIGNKVGKSGNVEIPLFGNKKLYQKQKEKIREFSY